VDDPYSYQTCVVLWLDRDDDVRTLVGWDVFWRVSGPKTIRRAITWLIEHPDEPMTRVPANIAAYVSQHRS
jgi:hypothetical protein